ncbi:MAG TPA: hypothetical protein VK197_06350 [Verrucomicrobiae bacterium]|jgi:hypothetical protein|nr:hypothetical protein [Verrucomicrobiae bacterium]
MTGDNELVGIGMVLLVVAAVLVFAMSGSVEAALLRVDLMNLLGAIGEALRSLAGAVGI